MCKINAIHEACKAGARDGKCFPLNDFDLTMKMFASQFADENAQAAYCSNFLAEIGRRLSPVACM